MKPNLEQLAKKGRVNVISTGLNMDCEKVITKSVLYFEEGRFCLRNCGVNMYCDDTTDLLLDTKENRELLKRQLMQVKTA